MALTEIITVVGETMIFDMARGNTGTLVDIDTVKNNTVEIPSAAGSIFIMSE